MKLVSINVGGPREIEWGGTLVRTSIFKELVASPVRVGKVNLVGDEQSDLTVHGGVDKAVYVYPSEHYTYWREQLEVKLRWGAFGENLTTEGLSEKEVKIGDRLDIGSAKFVVTQPRLPCYKLGLRFGNPDMVKRFHQSGRPGFYLAVLQEGEISAGDSIDWLPEGQPSVSVADIARLYTTRNPEPELLRQASELSVLPDMWREQFRGRLRSNKANL